jgi:nucleoside-diphosphate-sugar epimerase
MIGVTGANGYVGGRIITHLRASGIEAIALVRRPSTADALARRYELGEPIERSLLDGIETVVHAAYDASAQGSDIRARNVTGSLPLLEGLHERGGRMLMVSSLSSFEGTHSQYGRAKLELERAVLDRDGIVLRPGLVFGAAAGGLFGAMVRALSTRGLVPMIGGGSQRLFVTHDEHLAELVVALIAGRAEAAGPLFAAHESPTTLRAIAEQIARTGGHRLVVVALPPALVALGLRSAEIAGIPLPFRSDSLRSLLHPIGLDQVSSLARSRIAFPALEPELWLS